MDEDQKKAQRGLMTLFAFVGGVSLLATGIWIGSAASLLW